jgi:hypothetical protein
MDVVTQREKCTCNWFGCDCIDIVKEAEMSRLRWIFKFVHLTMFSNSFRFAQYFYTISPAMFFNSLPCAFAYVCGCSLCSHPYVPAFYSVRYWFLL